MRKLVRKTGLYSRRSKPSQQVFPGAGNPLAVSPSEGGWEINPEGTNQFPELSTEKHSPCREPISLVLYRPTPESPRHPRAITPQRPTR